MKCFGCTRVQVSNTYLSKSEPDPIRFIYYSFDCKSHLYVLSKRIATFVFHSIIIINYLHNFVSCIYLNLRRSMNRNDRAPREQFRHGLEHFWNFGWALCCAILPAIDCMCVRFQRGKSRHDFWMIIWTQIPFARCPGSRAVPRNICVWRRIFH